MNELANISQVADAVAMEVAEISDAESVAAVVQTMDRVRVFCDRAKELKQQLEAALVAYIKQNGPITIGPVRWYVGTKRKVKCRDNGQAVRTFLEIGGPELLRDVLASGAFKHGEARERLAESGNGELYDVLFETVEETELRDGKPERIPALLSADERFINRRERQ